MAIAKPISPQNNNQKPPPALPAVKPTTPQDTEGKVILDNSQEDEQQPVSTEESSENLDPQQAEEEADAVIPKTQQNPFSKPDIDKLTQQQFNEDTWRIMRGALPCLETSAACLQQLQERAIAQSPLLKEIDNRITEANQKIQEAKSRNQKSIQLSILTPALQYMLGPTSTNTETKTPGLLDNIAAIFRGDLGIINGLLRVVGVPLFQGAQGGNADAQQRAIAISDISVKVAELQRSRAQLAETIREKVAISLVKFDEARTDYQTSQVMGLRAVQQFQVYSIRYIRGNSDTESYLAHQNSLDRTKSQTYAAWAKMRRALFEIKLLVLNVKDAEN